MGDHCLPTEICCGFILSYTLARHGHPADSFCCSVPYASAQAACRPDFCARSYPRCQPLVMPYVDINPHKGRPKWQGYAVLGVLLVLTAIVITAAFARI